MCDWDTGGTCPSSREEGPDVAQGPPQGRLALFTLRTEGSVLCTAQAVMSSAGRGEQWDCRIAARLWAVPASPAVSQCSADLSPPSSSSASLPSADRMLLAAQIFPVEHRIVP